MNQLEVSQEQFKRILIELFLRGQESNSIEIKELIKEIEMKLASVFDRDKT